MRKLAATAVLAASIFVPAFTGSANAAPVFSQDFETDSSGWFDGGGYGDVQRVSSGTNGVTSSSGSFHAIVTQGGSPGGESGPYTQFGSYRDTFPGTYSAAIDIYLDTSWSAGSGFDYSVASNRTDGTHLRDFVFHVTLDSSTGGLLVGGNNNSNFAPHEDLETLNHYVVGTSGWYTFEHVFRDESGQLVVDLNLLDEFGNLLFTETRSTATDTIPDVVGGNRYGWFTNIDIQGGIAVDNASLEVASVPEPGTLATLGLGLVGLTLLARRRNVV